MGDDPETGKIVEAGIAGQTVRSRHSHLIHLIPLEEKLPRSAPNQFECSRNAIRGCVRIADLD